MADWQDILKGAEKQTNDEFASTISSLTRLTDNDIKAIAPNPTDQKKLAQLLSIVTDNSKNNTEKANAIKNIDGVMNIAIPLIIKLCAA